MWCCSVIYRRPRSNLDDFSRDYRMVLEQLGSRKIYICGDLNLNLIHYEINNSVHSFVDLCFEYSYIPLIKKPNRVYMHSANVFDHILHNPFDSTLKCGILMSDSSDHFSPFVISSDSIDDAEVEDSFFCLQMLGKHGEWRILWLCVGKHIWIHS